MTIISKFVYEPLPRVEEQGKRHYLTPDGESLPSVTTILSATKSKESIDALARWRTAVGEKKANEIVTEAASRGSRMHLFLEHYIKHDTRKQAGTNPYSKISKVMADTIIDQGLCDFNEIWGSEVPLYFPGLYSGTCDGIGLYNGQPAIFDFKQSNKVKDESMIEDYYCQLCAYALAHNEIHGTNIRTGVILMCVKPAVDVNLVITEDPKFLKFVITDTEFDYWSRVWTNKVAQYYRITE